MSVLRVEGFEIFRCLIDRNLTAFINFVILPCKHSRLAPVQHDVMLLIHLGQLGVNREFFTALKDTDQFTFYVRLFA